MDEYILRLDIPVDNIMFMQIFDCLSNLFNVLFYLFLQQTVILILAHVFEQISAETGLEKEIDVVLINKELIDVYDVWMIEKALYFDFSDKLIKTILIQEGSIDHLQAIDEIRCLVSI